MSGQAGNDGLSWDTVDMKTETCTLATATARPDSVVLNFGIQVPDDDQVLAMRPKLVRRIALRPASAKHLRDMLSQAMPQPDGER